MIGDYAVGKTSLVANFLGQPFYDDRLSTVGAVFLSKEINGTRIHIWDTAGSERYRSMMPMYYRSTDVVICCCEYRREKGWKSLKQYVEDAKQYCPDAKLILAFTKMDLFGDDDWPEVEKELEPVFEKVFYTSAKTGECIQLMFHYIATLDDKFKNIDLRPIEIVHFEDCPVPEENKCKC